MEFLPYLFSILPKNYVNTCSEILKFCIQLIWFTKTVYSTTELCTIFKKPECFIFLSLSIPATSIHKHHKMRSAHKHTPSARARERVRVRVRKKKKNKPKNFTTRRILFVLFLFLLLLFSLLRTFCFGFLRIGLSLTERRLLDERCCRCYAYIVVVQFVSLSMPIELVAQTLDYLINVKLEKKNLFKVKIQCKVKQKHCKRCKT